MPLNLRCFFPGKRNGPAHLGTENDGIASKRIPAPPSFFRLFYSTNNRLPTQKEWTILNHGNHGNEFRVVLPQRMRFRTKSLLKVLLLPNSKYV